MSDQMLEYYRNYYTQGGPYTLNKAGLTSRVLVFSDWINTHLSKGSKILDVGCGDMQFSKYLPDYQWVGIDINTEKAQATAVAHDIMTTPYPFDPESFDAVVCSEVLEHVWDLRVVHREVRRLLKPEGQYFLSTPNFDWIEHKVFDYRHLVTDPSRPWTMEHIRQYTPRSHIDFLSQEGFRVADYTGADAQHGEFFQEARRYLKTITRDNILKGAGDRTDGLVDLMLGRMFRQVSHTIALHAVKGVSP